MQKTTNLTAKRGGNSLAVWIPASVARPTGFSTGQPIDVTPHASGGEVQLSLAQKLGLFDPGLHGGESMAAAPAGKEKI